MGAVGTAPEKKSEPAAESRAKQKASGRKPKAKAKAKPKPVGFAALEGLQRPQKPEEVDARWLLPGQRELTGVASDANSPGEEAEECAICLDALGSNREEVGALTFEGKRIEPNLYHLGCITMILVTKRCIKIDSAGQQKVSWGLSPVTRKPVDGFQRMPPLEERTRWVEFVDWKGDRRLNVADLALAVAAMLPVQAGAMKLFMCSNFKVDSEGVITGEELETAVLPYLEEHCQQLRREKADETVRRARAQQDHLWSCLESHGNGTAEPRGDALGAIIALGNDFEQGNPRFINIAAALMENPDDKVRRAALGLLQHAAAKGDQQACEAVIARLSHALGTIRRTAVEALGVVSYAGDQQAIGELAARVGDREPHVRCAVLSTLAQIAEVGDQQVVQIIAGRIEDQNRYVRCAAVEALVKVAPKGDQCATAAVSCGLLDFDPAVRAASVSALAQLVEKGSEFAVETNVLSRPSLLVWGTRTTQMCAARRCRPLGMLRRRGIQKLCGCAVRCWATVIPL